MVFHSESLAHGARRDNITHGSYTPSRTRSSKGHDSYSRSYNNNEHDSRDQRQHHSSRTPSSRRNPSQWRELHQEDDILAAIDENNSNGSWKSRQRNNINNNSEPDEEIDPEDALEIEEALMNYLKNISQDEYVEQPDQIELKKVDSGMSSITDTCYTNTTKFQNMRKKILKDLRKQQAHDYFSKEELDMIRDADDEEEFTVDDEEESLSQTEYSRGSIIERGSNRRNSVRSVTSLLRNRKSHTKNDEIPSTPQSVSTKKSLFSFASSHKKKSTPLKAIKNNFVNRTPTSTSKSRNTIRKLDYKSPKSKPEQSFHKGMKQQYERKSQIMANITHPKSPQVVTSCLSNFSQSSVHNWATIAVYAASSILEAGGSHEAAEAATAAILSASSRFQDTKPSSGLSVAAEASTAVLATGVDKSLAATAAIAVMKASGNEHCDVASIMKENCSPNTSVSRQNSRELMTSHQSCRPPHPETSSYRNRTRGTRDRFEDQSTEYSGTEKRYSHRRQSSSSSYSSYSTPEHSRRYHNNTDRSSRRSYEDLSTSFSENDSFSIKTSDVKKYAKELSEFVSKNDSYDEEENGRSYGHMFANTPASRNSRDSETTTSDFSLGSHLMRMEASSNEIELSILASQTKKILNSVRQDEDNIPFDHNNTKNIKKARNQLLRLVRKDRQNHS